MPNGKPGDHPLTDIVVHGRRIYSPAVDALVREIVQLGGRDQIANLLLLEFNELGKSDVRALEARLRPIRDRLREQRT